MGQRWIRGATGLIAYAVAAVIALGAASPPPSDAAPLRRADGSTCALHWVRAWNSASTDAVSLFDPGLMPNPALTDQSFRSIATPGIAGAQIRVHLTNRFRSTPLVLDSVTVGTQRSAAEITDAPAPVSFSGAPTITIPPFGTVVSDPVAFDVVPFEAMAVTTYVPGDATRLTGHWNGNTTTYLSAAGSGDHTFDTEADAFVDSTTNDLILAGVDVLSPATTTAVVAFGDSITDGFVAQTPLVLPESRSGVDSNTRYPSQLQRRVVDTRRSLSVVNSGITANRLLSDGLIPQQGSSGLDRVEADIVGVDGARDVIVLEGINDLGLPPWSSAKKVVAGYRTLIDTAHSAGIRVHLGTILPASNSLLNGTVTAPFSNIERLAINTWIRTSNEPDSVIDFDLALRDPANPDILDPRYASVDNLHPNPAGYRAMADAVDLDAFSTLACSQANDQWAG